ncbi:MAG: type I restriction enzyme HsdR N-terminal domain-containing protein [Bacteroidetes bacterium]|nr:MAG: type I restriction enzyme HsdR N-terminal domain-containing protein [Bacteroidota bacterium]
MSSYPSTLYPSDQIRLKKERGTDYIYDSLRKKWLVLTPEEWVRQHLLLHVHHVLNYPVSSIAIEKVIEINGMPKRFDALVYVQSKPAILIECKAPNVALTEEVFHQACRYNTEINAPLTVLFNGLQVIVASVDITTGKVGFLKEIPTRSQW